MKPFKQFREECDCKDKERKTKSKSKKKGQVEVMPRIPDEQKGMTTNVNNESKSYVTEKSVSKSQQRFFGMVRQAQKKGEKKAASPEVARVAASIKKSDAKDFASTKHKGLPEKKVKKESFESGVLKARRYHRVGKLMSFKDFMKIMGEIMGEWEK
jgi:hypothetical protein